jgi:Domain of unknown function (DUF4258)
MIRFTKHAQEAISIRDITIDWIEAAVGAPDWIELDPRYPGRTRSYKAIAEYGARVLRVVHRPEGDDIVIITVHFDRGARR